MTPAVIGGILTSFVSPWILLITSEKQSKKESFGIVLGKVKLQIHQLLSVIFLS